MYSVVYDEHAINYLNKLPSRLKTRIFNKITSTKNNPYHFFEKLEGQKGFKLRIGDYRAIADINDADNRIEITVIGHRKNIYDKMS